MPREDWYRNNTWNPGIESAFFTKLAKCRSQRDQCLAIQALTLAKTHPDVALKLVDHYFDTQKDDASDSQAFLARIDALKAKGDIAGALSTMKILLERESTKPHQQTMVSFDYPYLVGLRRVKAHYDDALSVLEEYAQKPIMFPVDGFKRYAAYAFIRHTMKDYDLAVDYARKALTYAAATRTALQYHPFIGLVGNRHEAATQRLARIIKLRWFYKLIS